MRHADAVVLDGELLVVLVERDGDLEGRRVARQLRIGHRLVAELLAGVGAVRDQLAQENVAVGIDRMHHEVQKPGNVGLEFVVFGLARLTLGLRLWFGSFDVRVHLVLSSGNR